MNADSKNTPDKNGDINSDNNVWKKIVNGYLIKAVVVYIVMYTAYNYSVDNHTKFWNNSIQHISELSSSTFNKIFDDKTSVGVFGGGIKGEIQTNDAAYIRVTVASLGIPIMLAIVAGIVCWPASWQLKASTVAILLAASFALIIVRISALLLTDIYWVRHLELATNWLVPSALALVYLTLFMGFTKLSGRHPEAADSS